MPQRRADADRRRFFDEFASVRVSRLRATGVIDPSVRHAVVPFPDGTQKLIGTAHVRFARGGGYSYFLCPRCAKLAGVLYQIDGAPLCVRCCAAQGIAYRTRAGFGRTERLRARGEALDRLVAKVGTEEPLRFKPAPANWGGRCRFVGRSRSLTVSMRRRLIELRLNQFASQQACALAEDGDRLKTHRPIAAARQVIGTEAIWRARTWEQLERALDDAQGAVLAALASDDPRRRLQAARLMLRSRQARERGL